MSEPDEAIDAEPSPAERSHRRRHSPLTTFKKCNQCRLDRRRCEKKIRLLDLQEATEWVESFNRERNYEGSLVVHYKCVWCGYRHMATAKKKVQLQHVEKMRRRWLMETQGPKELRDRIKAKRLKPKPTAEQKHTTRLSRQDQRVYQRMQNGLEARAENQNLGPRPGVRSVFAD